MAISATALRDAIKAAIDTAFGTMTGSGNTARTNFAAAFATPIADAHNLDSGSSSIPYELSVFFRGGPDVSDLLLRAVFVQAVTFSASLSGSRVTAGTAATSSYVLSIRKNGSEVATATFGAGSATATLSSSGFSMADGDVLTVVAPVGQDATLADISISLKGART